jgi:hypothetical protein
MANVGELKNVKHWVRNREGLMLAWKVVVVVLGVEGVWCFRVEGAGKGVKKVKN